MLHYKKYHSLGHQRCVFCQHISQVKDAVSALEHAKKLGSGEADNALYVDLCCYHVDGRS